MGLISVEARFARCQLFHLVSAHPSTAVWELKGVGSLTLLRIWLVQRFVHSGVCSVTCVHFPVVYFSLSPVHLLIIHLILLIASLNYLLIQSLTRSLVDACLWCMCLICPSASACLLYFFHLCWKLLVNSACCLENRGPAAPNCNKTPSQLACVCRWVFTAEFYL